MTKAAVVSGEDDNTLATDVDPDLEEGLLVPPPPDPADDNATGIPDHSRKTIDTGLSESVVVDPNAVDNNDGKPFINESIYPVRQYDYVSWEGPLGMSYGQVVDVITRGSVEVPGTGLVMIAEPGDPVCKILVYRNDNGMGWRPTDTTVGYKMSGLHVIDPLEPVKGTDPVENFDVQRVIDVKGLKVKAVDGKIQGEFKASFKKFAEPSLKDYTPDTTKMAKINKGALVTMSPEDVIVVSLQAADTKVDRGYEAFLPSAIDTLAKLYPDKPILLDHDWSVKSIVGKIFDGHNDNGDLVLEGFFPTSNKELVDNVLKGVYCKLSVGFAASPENMICSACSKSMFDMACKHQPGEVLKDGSQVIMLYKDVNDVFEVSIVAVPMQPAAHIRPTKVVDQTEPDEAFKSALFTAVVGDGITTPTITYALAGRPIVSLAVGGVNPPADTIVNGIDTKRNSQTMDETPKSADNLAGVAPVGAEGAGVQVDSLPKAEPKPDNDDDDDKDGYGKKALHLKLDATQELIKSVATVCSELNSTMSKMFGTMTHISENMGGFGGAPTTGTDTVKSAGELANEALLKQLELMNTKLEIATKASTPGVTKFLMEELEAAQKEEDKVSRKYWAQELYPVNDQGGQK